jgi:hypothetical protein
MLCSRQRLKMDLKRSTMVGPTQVGAVRGDRDALTEIDASGTRTVDHLREE